ncbi:HAD superfamily hydrolase (TIGR01549 family) [Saccharomonospora amisosensis]|uniref:HAD superfamily hydrolase (TIGR01549 family) n=1 Tax=Saccharomonospora amisosensis TaxID=1128677 RepID=A0A7X5UKR1_9PSEU|nr:HAD family hydrolase [Saccharomonospora amisosensis]NIJ09827.1 HAD superfamily hydrolase (TIGR01549 family) [Saccharomonospora amisosensis]
MDETTEYGTWADWLGVPRHTFSAVFGAVIARGLDYREAFQVFQPGFDLETARRTRAEAGQPETFDETDLYNDVRPCLGKLREQGLVVGVAGNQTARAEGILRALQLPIDVLGTSDSWNASKPSPAFFQRLIVEAGVRAEHILYVGDRLDNDIRPAVELGIKTAVIRRGPWGHILRDEVATAILGTDVEASCLFQLDSLLSLASLVAEHNEAARGAV